MEKGMTLTNAYFLLFRKYFWKRTQVRKLYHVIEEDSTSSCTKISALNKYLISSVSEIRVQLSRWYFKIKVQKRLNKIKFQK